ncbi:hypothetical protein HWV62_41212 [Athelia sp. TMB]|nr:hypothetical protein HWV62_41212 [Athelia sp. TMB]
MADPWLDSVISLFRSYPGHAGLQGYLEYAIGEGSLSVATYTTVFLQATRSPELQDAATLELLCRITISSHYSSGLASPIGSVVSYTESPAVVLGMIHDALYLLRASYSLPMSHSHQLISSAGELVILLLSCVADTSQITTAQAMVSFEDANHVLSTLQLSPDVRQVLETFAMSLTLIIGDNAKVARETQMLQSMLAMGKPDIHGSNTGADTTTSSLLLHTLLSARAGSFGAGNEPEAVACLLAFLRWTSWTPATFYSQVIHAAFTCISQCGSVGPDAGAFFLWRAFVIGRLPRLLVVFENVLEKEGGSKADWASKHHQNLQRFCSPSDSQRAAMQTALISIIGHSDLVAQCDHVVSQVGPRHGSENQPEDPEAPKSFVREFLQHLVMAGLIDHTFAITVDPMISNEHTPRLRLEVQETGIDLEAFIDSKIVTESADDSAHLLERICRDPGCHAALAQVVKKRFASLSGASEIEPPSQLSKLLYTNEFALDIVSLHVRVSEIAAHALRYLSEYDCEAVDHQQLDLHSCKTKENSNPSALLWSPAIIYTAEEMTGERAVAFSAWFKALFDSSSEGIEDTILRSTKPWTLLAISPTLVSHAISARMAGKIDADVLNNGVSYFTGPLLNWTLVGVIKDTLTNTPPGAWLEQARQIIRDALQLGRAGKAPAVDIDRCLATLKPLAFIHLLWFELAEASRIGPMEVCKQLGTFILAMPPSTNSPRLLPLFLHVVLPSIIGGIDNQLPSELKALNIDLLIGVVSSTLCATFQLEVALHTLRGDKHVLLPSSMYMARRLASDLRRKESQTSSLLTKGLAGNPSFVANFPVFMLTEM